MVRAVHENTFIYVEKLGLYVEFNLLLARYQPSFYTVIDAKGNIHEKPYWVITDGGSVCLPSIYTYNKTKYQGLDAIVMKLKNLYPEIAKKITKQRIIKELERCIEQGKYQETSIKNKVKIYLYLDCYEKGKVKPNSKTWFKFKGKSQIDFPESQVIMPVPLG